MRVLFAAAVSLAAAVAPAAGGAPHLETLYARTGTSISGFAQDRRLIAWFARGDKGCNTVHVLSVANGLTADGPNPSARNVTCTWQVGNSLVPLAVAFTTSDT